jgi:hypothetical protein
MRWINFGFHKADLGPDLWQEFKPKQDHINALLTQIVESGDYGDAVETIFIAPVLLRNAIAPKGTRLKKFDKLIKAARYRYPIDREQFLNGNDHQRMHLIKENIFMSLTELGKSIAGFNAEALISCINDSLK